VNDLTPGCARGLNGRHRPLVFRKGYGVYVAAATTAEADMAIELAQDAIMRGGYEGWHFHRLTEPGEQT
jgi:hypothetical protein